MSPFDRPGIYQRPVRPTRRVGGLARLDVPVLIGFTTRGPTQEPVRVESLRQARAIFGPPVQGGFLMDALNGFFETGGRAAYVQRLTGAGARPASGRLDLGAQWFDASARMRTADLALLRDGVAPMQWQDHLARTYGAGIPDPGGWANGLDLTLDAEARPGRPGYPEPGGRRSLSVEEITGLEQGTLVRVIQGADVDISFLVTEADRLRRRITLDRDLPAEVDLTAPITLVPVSYALQVRQAGELAEALTGLSLNPEAPRFVAEVVERESRFVALTVGGAFDPAALPEFRAQVVLSGGTDGLREQAEADWIAALTAQARIDEIAMIAAPDLVRAIPDEVEERGEPMPSDAQCHLPQVRPTATLSGEVVDAETEAPLDGVRIIAAGEGAGAISGPDGRFALTGLSGQLVELRLSKPGYVPATQQAEPRLAGETGPEDLLSFPLARRTDIPALDRAAIDAVQAAMTDPAVVGPFRIAVLDPPQEAATPQALLEWSGALPRVARAFAVAPWLAVPTEDDTLRDCPPSGHVCASFAVSEIHEGVHRSPANHALRAVKSLAMSVPDGFAAEAHRGALNLISPFPGRGIRLNGSRTLSAASEWTHVSVRRLFDAIEKTLLSRLKWAVFEPNGPATRQILQFAITQFLERLRGRGMFAGQSAAEAYTVLCNDDTNPPAGQARGELVAEIGIAPTEPYEFILFSIAAEADALDVTEAP